jgi:hypothetical protein
MPQGIIQRNPYEVGTVDRIGSGIRRSISKDEGMAEGIGFENTPALKNAIKRNSYTIFFEADQVGGYHPFILVTRLELS